MSTPYNRVGVFAFIDLTHPSFNSDYVGIESIIDLENSLDDIFLSGDPVRLRYTVAFSSSINNTGRVGFSWDIGTESSYAVFTFNKDSGNWKFYSVDDDKTFLLYRGEVANVVLSAADTSLTADETDSTIITATVTDALGHAMENGTIVTFFTDVGTITASASTLGGEATVDYTTPWSSSVTTATLYAVSGTVQSDDLIITLIPMAPPGPPEKQ